VYDLSSDVIFNGLELPLTDMRLQEHAIILR